MASRKAKRAAPVRKSKPSTKSRVRASRPTPAPKRPPQVPLADWRKLSDATKKRYSAAAKKNPLATRQQLRGHKPSEHVTRAQHRQERIEAFVAVQAHRGANAGADPDTIREHVEANIAEHGAKWFQNVEKLIAQLHNEYVESGYTTVIGSDGLAALAEQLGMDPEELFYH